MKASPVQWLSSSFRSEDRFLREMYYKFISEREDCTSLWLLNGLLTETGLKVWEEEPELLSNVSSL